MAENNYHGHVTLDDGTRFPLTEDEENAIWKAIKAAEAKSAADMPKISDVLRVMQRGHSRLCNLGWREAQYCPKDGTTFAVIQYGSTGIFEAWYMGDWPTGHVYCCDYLSHPDGMLFKPLADLTDGERALMDECMNREKAAHDREIASLISQSNQEKDRT